MDNFVYSIAMDKINISDAANLAEPVSSVSLLN
jgi:hypothetical protein